MIRWAARLLLRFGAALLIMSVVIRPAIHTEHGLMGDNLAIISCLVLIGTALLYIRFGPKDDTEQPAPRRDPKRNRRHSAKHP